MLQTRFWTLNYADESLRCCLACIICDVLIAFTSVRLSVTATTCMSVRTSQSINSNVIMCWRQTAGEAVDVAAALVEYGPGERSMGRACCLALCQAGAVQPLLKMITGEPQRPSSIKVAPHSLPSPWQLLTVMSFFRYSTDYDLAALSWLHFVSLTLQACDVADIRNYEQGHGGKQWPQDNMCTSVCEGVSS